MYLELIRLMNSSDSYFCHGHGDNRQLAGAREMGQTGDGGRRCARTGAIVIAARVPLYNRPLPNRGYVEADK